MANDIFTPNYDISAKISIIDATFYIDYWYFHVSSAKISLMGV